VRRPGNRGYSPVPQVGGGPRFSLILHRKIAETAGLARCSANT